MPPNNQKNFLKQPCPPMDVSDYQTLWKDYSYWKFSMKSNGIKEKRCMLMYSFPSCGREDGNIWCFVFFPFAFFYFAPDVFSQIENMPLAKLTRIIVTNNDDNFSNIFFSWCRSSPAWAVGWGHAGWWRLRWRFPLPQINFAGVYRGLSRLTVTNHVHLASSSSFALVNLKALGTTVNAD